MAQFTIYKSTDASAPVLTGQAGSLVALLDSCLVNGYGAKAAAGWTKAFSGTNKAAYQQGAGSPGFYFRVRDDAGGTGGAKEALARGGESMSDVDTFTNPFPSNAQSALTDNSLMVRKSATADAAARAWIVIADSRTCYLFITSGDNYQSSGAGHTLTMMGEFYSLLTDSYRCAIHGQVAENAASVGAIANQFLNLSPAMATATAGFFLARSYTGVAGSKAGGKAGNSLFLSASGSYPSGGLAYPNTPDSSIYLNPLWVTESAATSYRGRLRGLWQWPHAAAVVNDGDTFVGGGDLTGKTFLIVKPVISYDTSSGNGVACVLAVETSNTLESN